MFDTKPEKGMGKVTEKEMLQLALWELNAKNPVHLTNEIIFSLNSP